MPSIVELLEATARYSPDGPDPEALRQRATALRHRERVLAVAALLVVAAIAVPVLRWGGAGSQGLEQVPATTPPPVSASPSAGAPRHRAVGGGQPPGASTGAQQVGSPAATPGTRSAAAAQPSVRPVSPSANAGYPRADSCAVSTANLPPGQSSTCQFRATKAGGADVRIDGQRPGLLADGSSHVTMAVDRDGRISRYDLFATKSFCVSSVIRPGDLVQLTVRQEDSGYFAFTAAAGSGHGC